MSKYPDSLITPLFEITSVVNPLPFSMSTALERIRGWNLYREPPLYNRGSEKKYMFTHQYVGVNRLPYALSRVTEDPVGSAEVNGRLFLRYQLNPYHPPCMPAPHGFENHVYRNQLPYLREVFVEAVLLHPNACEIDVSSSGSRYGVCGINVYTDATGVFSEFPRRGHNDVALIFSTVPGVREKLQGQFNDRRSSPSLVVDDAFISWDTLGFVSLNELQDMDALHVEEDYTGILDLPWS